MREAEFLTKPCRDEDLLTAIEQAIHRGRQMEQLKMLGVTRMQLSTRLKRFDLRS